MVLSPSVARLVLFRRRSKCPLRRFPYGHLGWFAVDDVILRAKRIFLAELKDIVTRMGDAERNALRDSNVFVGARDAELYRRVAAFAHDVFDEVSEEIATVGEIVRTWKVREASEIETDNESDEISRDWEDEY